MSGSFWVEVDTAHVPLRKNPCPQQPGLGLGFGEVWSGSLGLGLVF